jgi:hypothetical protein
MDHMAPSFTNRPLMGCLTISLATIILISVFTGIFEVMCTHEMNKFMIPYPGAEVTEIDYNFLRAKGVGRTIYYMETEDDPLLVQGWYGKLSGETARERNLTRVRFSARYNEDRTRTNIVIAASCIAPLPNM